MVVIKSLHNSLKFSKFDHWPEEGSRSSQPRCDRTKNELHVECRQCPYKGPASSEPPKMNIHHIVGQHIKDQKEREGGENKRHDTTQQIPKTQTVTLCLLRRWARCPPDGAASLLELVACVQEENLFIFLWHVRFYSYLGLFEEVVQYIYI